MQNTQQNIYFHMQNYIFAQVYGFAYAKVYTLYKTYSFANYVYGFARSTETLPP